MSSKNSELWRQARRARDTLVEQLIDRPEISLIDIGYDPTPGPSQDPDGVVVRVHVRQLGDEQSLDLPPELEGIPVRVVAGDYQPDQQAAPPPPEPAAAATGSRPARRAGRGGRSRSKASEPGRKVDGQEPPTQSSDPGWQGLADFVLSFGLGQDGAESRLETRVRHVQSEKEMRWPGLAFDEIRAWLASQPGLPAPLDPTGQAADQASRAELKSGETAVVELSGLWVSEVQGTARSGRPGGSRLHAEVCFSVVEPTAEVLSARQVPYTIEFSLLNTATHESSTVARYEGWVRPDEMDCPIEQDFAIPPLGRYRLNLFARLMPPGQGSDRLAGPVIVVET